MKLSLYRIILPVPDIDKAARFYSTLFDQQGTRVSEGRHYFNLGGTILACYDPKADGDEINKGWRFHDNQYLYVAVNDLEKIYAQAKAIGAQQMEQIEEMPWGERLFYCRDPFGSPLCFVDDQTLFKG